jgi:hypothetical protein
MADKESCFLSRHNQPYIVKPAKFEKLLKPYLSCHSEGAADEPREESLEAGCQISGVRFSGSIISIQNKHLVDSGQNLFRF